MDGIDGLAGAEATLGRDHRRGAVPAGRDGRPRAGRRSSSPAAAAGFLGWNWPPARIFMGDVGSGFLGFMFGALSLIADRSGALPLALGLLLAGVFAFDATVTLVRRMARGERWYQAHRSHAYQRLVQAGRTHAEVTGGVLLVNLGLGALAWLAQSGRLSAWRRPCLRGRSCSRYSTLPSNGGDRCSPSHRSAPRAGHAARPDDTRHSRAGGIRRLRDLPDPAAQHRAGQPDRWWPSCAVLLVPARRRSSP